jgi:hypothetical protein
VLDGRNISRYGISWGGVYLAYDVNKIHSCKRTDIFEAKEKLLFRRVGDSLTASYDDAQFYALNTIVVITPKATDCPPLKYLLGLINSRLLNFYYVNFLKSTKKVFSEIQARQLAALPIVDADKQATARIVSLVDTAIKVKRDIAEAKSPDVLRSFEKKFRSIDKAIDEQVFALYKVDPKSIEKAGSLES